MTTPGTLTRAAAIVGVVAVTPGIALLLLAMTGGMDLPAVAGLPDAGQLTRYVLPATQGVRDFSAMTTVGMLVLAAVCVPVTGPAGERTMGGAQRLLVRLAMLTSGTWAWVSLVLLAFTYSEASGTPVGSPGFGEQATFFATDFDLGRYLLASSVLAGLVAVGCAVARRVESLGYLVLGSLAGMWPVALTGHGAGTLNHDDAVNLQFVHLVGVSVWIGGLIGLLMVRRRLRGALAASVGRYSQMAGWCLVLVGASGVMGALLRVPSLSSLDSRYGALLLAKSAGLVTLAGLGWWQRARLIRRLGRGDDRAFGRIALLEVVVLAGSAGIGVALGRTAPPAPAGGEQPLSAAQSLLGRDLPPELGAGEWFTQWQPNSFWLPVALFMVGWYAWAVLRLKARGDSWPVLRSLSWTAGWLMFVWATNGSPDVYGDVLFSMHMVQHMTIATAVPVFLVLGAPVTLALRALPRRTDGSLGAREWLQEGLASLPAQILSLPVVAAGGFVISLVGFYYSGLFESSLEAHTGHLLMVAHFLVSGYLLANCLVGIDPGVHRPAFPLRALLLMVTFAFHSFFSVSLLSSNTVLGEDWFTALGRPWGPTLLEDQRLGAGIGWALGDAPLAILAGALLALWVGADRRERRRFDRNESRTGDRSLEQYNAYLARLSATSDRPVAPSDEAHAGLDATKSHRHGRS